MSASISRVVWTVSVTGNSWADSRWAGGPQCGRPWSGRAGRSVQVCTTAPRSCARRGREERRAPDPIEEVRGHPALEERLVRQEGLVDRHVGHDALEHELVE